MGVGESLIPVHISSHHVEPVGPSVHAAMIAHIRLESTSKTISTPETRIVTP